MRTGATVRAATAEDFDALHDVVDIAFHRGSPERRRLRMRALQDEGLGLVAVDGDRIVGTTGAWSWDLGVPGGTLPVAAITIVTVLPTHRRRGILRALMERATADARDRGEPLAALWASEGGIYGRFGYGPATWVREGRAQLRGGLGLRPPTTGPEADLPLRLLTAEEAHPVVAPVFERARARRGGLLSRDGTWWTVRLLADEPEDRGGASPLRVVVAGDDGYALYRVREGATTGPVSAWTTVEVAELVAVTPAAERALLAFLSSIDLADELVLDARPVDDPLLHTTADVRAIVPGTPADALWLRILDVPAAVAGRSWAADVDLVLEVLHPEDPVVAGRWRLRGTSGAPGAVVAARTDGPADLVLHARDLGSLYLGGATATGLRDAGAINEATAGTAVALDAALRVERAPWTAGVF
ncbi:GNAT family N-acetyltransferase [Patulibacter minatonensis]|uniref:GNAT family N-acetyltransferase n=1 Tax=Patulibacter minatonensis TaxID=298163 RepID=UPI0004ACCCB9|nr:GNAT family N-acetyltransferase [Patulibacter minatonensis]